MLNNPSKRSALVCDERIKWRIGREGRAQRNGREQYSQDGGLGGHGWYPLEAQEHAADSGAEAEAFGWALDRGGICSACHHHHHHHQCQGRLQDAGSLARPPLTPSVTHDPRVTDTSATVSVDIPDQSSLHTAVHKHHATHTNSL